VGEPILYGWVNHYLAETLKIFSADDQLPDFAGCFAWHEHGVAHCCRCWRA